MIPGLCSQQPNLLENWPPRPPSILAAPTQLGESNALGAAKFRFTAVDFDEAHSLGETFHFSFSQQQW